MIKAIGIENKEIVKEKLIKAMETFNNNGHIIPEKEKINVCEFINKNNKKSLVLVHEDFLIGKRNINELDYLLNEIHEDIALSGNQCHIKKMLISICKTDEPMNIDTIISFMVILNSCTTNETLIMTNLIFCIYECYMTTMGGSL